MDNLPKEITIKIINYLLPFDLLIPFKDPLQIKFEHNPSNYKQIFDSNINIINLTKTCKIIKKYCYELGFSTIYFQNKINIMNISLFNSKIVIAPNDKILNNKDLNQINLKTLIATSNLKLDHIKFYNKNILEFKTAWIPMIYFVNNFNGQLDYFEFNALNFEYFINDKAINLFNKMHLDEYSNIKNIDTNFYRFELFINKVDENDFYLIVKLNSNLIIEYLTKELKTFLNYHFFHRFI